MAHLYLMRHGQTLFNSLKMIQGWCDSPLTELGVQQAKAAADYFSKNGITFDHAYSSTSERACDTLEIVTGGTMRYERLKGLKEWNFGRFEA
ncbi:MAG: histidine phosphatase family protein, partial [Spirochaetaceae bacterium]|nr:histidine phosphatase family protein [Spirochaetaceae bacterium]